MPFKYVTLKYTMLNHKHNYLAYKYELFHFIEVEALDIFTFIFLLNNFKNMSVLNKISQHTVYWTYEKQAIQMKTNSFLQYRFG